ncbi:NUDIX hydrolase [Effusibacillus lacus]|uniref:Coenzyme A pyrophosphatase n=1 Tax=Effusibacillus lacus TaxID=1348429 RepID=A0A292YK99_9BACL|nr:CoA pyrophosphatase [Effusibacillus lacus]TCS72073.1 8-oxo-dGTP pyrophosphatase MutT (NUDIX family) [Effusibacillus lacus]GAX90358.1 coenzyme A pyrophosphatase [Effusibacillus lacus]
MDDIFRVLKDRNASIMGSENMHRFSVLLPLVERDGEVSVLFEERAHHLNRQPGEICFPGGRIDPEDSNELAAAIRETCEELGLEPDQIQPLGSLDYMVTPFLIVHPFVGWIADYRKIRPNPDEVSSVFCVPLEVLRNSKPEVHTVDLKVMPPDDFPFQLIQGGRNYKWRSGKIPQFFYFHGDRIIWGMTARILHHFLEVIKNEDEKSGPYFGSTN